MELASLSPAPNGSHTERLQRIAAGALLEAWTPASGGGVRDAQQAQQLWMQMMRNTGTSWEGSSMAGSQASAKSAAHSLSPSVGKSSASACTLLPASLSTFAVMLSACKRNPELRALYGAHLVVDLALLATLDEGLATAPTSVQPAWEQVRALGADLVEWSCRGQRGAAAATLFLLPDCCSKLDSPNFAALRDDTQVGVE